LWVRPGTYPSTLKVLHSCSLLLQKETTKK
jgi:hypothetical protein